MGDPCPLSPAERLAVREIAARVVKSVIDDEKMPLPGVQLWRSSDMCEELDSCRREDVESLVMQLAQEIVALTAEKQAFCRAFQVVDVPKDSE